MPEKTSGRSRKGPAKAAASPGAPAGVDQYIVGQLKAIYDEVAAEPIPDRLRQLLDRLDRIREQNDDFESTEEEHHDED